MHDGAAKRLGGIAATLSQAHTRQPVDIEPTPRRLTGWRPSEPLSTAAGFRKPYFVATVGWDIEAIMRVAGLGQQIGI